MSARSPIVLRLFPNSGHQFFNIDLMELFERNGAASPLAGRTAEAPPPSIQELRQFVDSQRPEHGRSDTQRRKLEGWEEWADDGLTPWLLFRYDLLRDPRTHEDRPVLQLAVESNLGDFDRGTIVGLDRHTAGTPPPAHPFTEVLRQKGAQIPEIDEEDEDTVGPYLSREAELKENFPDMKFWLEDFLGGGRQPMPDRRKRSGGGDRLNRAAAVGRQVQLPPLPPETIQLQWCESQGDHPVDVDLIVDLGNTRTVALLLEDHGALSDPKLFGERIEPVRFLPRGWSFTNRSQFSKLEPFGLIDSWILLHRSPFANLEPPFSGTKLRTHSRRLPTPPDQSAAGHLIDQRFVALSPVLVGGGNEPTGAIKSLARSVLSDQSGGMHFFLSSPKRYAWDDTSVGTRSQYWQQVPNTHDVDNGELVPLSGLVRFFMNPSDPQHDLEQVDWLDTGYAARTDYGSPAKYPRRDSICWFALAIIEAAYRQMKSVEFLHSSNLPNRGRERRLRNVRVTYPAGWINEERDAYLAQWERALRLFGLAHLLDSRPISAGGETPELVTEPIDEAIASQLPILMSEVNWMGRDVVEWVSTYGDNERVRIMNIDIGGGTTDVAVIEYTRDDLGGRTADNLAGVGLDATLLHREGSDTAGDVLVKALLEKVIIRAWLDVNAPTVFGGNEPARKLARLLFQEPRNDTVRSWDNSAETRLARLVRLAFVPLANWVLSQLAGVKSRGENTLPDLDPQAVIGADAVDELNSFTAGFLATKCDYFAGMGHDKLSKLRLPGGVRAWVADARRVGGAKLPFAINGPVSIDLAAVNKVVDEVFEPLLTRLGDVAAKQACDLVIFSGKPSELPRLGVLMEKHLPLVRQRIMPVRGYRVGRWYPSTLLEEGNRIRDAKTVTVTGAALFEDLLHYNTKGLTLNVRPREAERSCGYHWGGLKTPGRLTQDDLDKCLFEAGTISGGPPKEVQTLLFSNIGRWRSHTGTISEPVYRLEYRPFDGGPVPDEARRAPVRLKIRLVVEADRGECLEIVPGSVKFLSPDAEGLDPASVVLHLQTMPDDDFWMDAPELDVDLSDLGEDDERQ